LKHRKGGFLLRRTSDQGVVYYQFEQWGNALSHGVFTRLGGISAPPWDSLNVGSTVGDDLANVSANRARMFAALRLPLERDVTVWQVHGADVAVAKSPPPGRRWLARADGLITDEEGWALSMRFADCVPILLYDPVRRVAGIAHAGWRGTVNGAGPATVRAMAAIYGCVPADIQAGIGPSIGPERYQVGEEVVEAVHESFGGTDGLIARDSEGSAYLNLWEANRIALAREGVTQIEVARICTASRTGEFFSHRAEKGRTGRFGAVISMTPTKTLTETSMNGKEERA
jgi:hypothetical protein